MSEKTIKFNPEFLSLSGSRSGNKTLKKHKKDKPIITMNPNKVKKQLIEKIKTFQLKEKNESELKENEITKEQLEKEKAESEFNNEFNNSVNFLQELAKKRKEKQKMKHKKNEGKNHTFKNGKIENEIKMEIATELPPEMMIPFKKSTTMQMQPAPIQMQVDIQMQPVPMQPVPMQPVPMQPAMQPAPIQMMQPAKPYSNLKNSTGLPSFSQWKRTTQKIANEPDMKPSLKIDDYEPPTIVPERSIALEQLKTKQSHVPKKIRHRITKTQKYTLGRKGDKVSVLIKNAKTRKLVQHELALLRQKSIPEIKGFLRTKNLLKVGSDAPNDVLRQIYEQSILSGDIENKAKDVLIHNYMNK